MKKELDSAQKGDSSLFLEALETIMADFSPRSREIVWQRYGIGSQKIATLEEIGGRFGITRERVRQIIREIYRKVEKNAKSDLTQKVWEQIMLALEANSGIMGESALVELLGQSTWDHKGAIRFFLDSSGKINRFEIKDLTEKSFAIKSFRSDKWKEIKKEIIDILKNEGLPISGEKLFSKFSQIGKFPEVSKKQLFDYLKVSTEVLQNAFGKWGLSIWKEVNPKGTRDKAFLVLKESGQPMHFRLIAQEIDQKGLSKKPTHPQTVHNELIKDKKFVLVGRGIYALVEWGYERGTVKDVLTGILQKNQNEMTKEDIIDEVLKVRQVKKSTIVINLNNHFKKNKQGKYSWQ